MIYELMNRNPCLRSDGSSKVLNVDLQWDSPQNKQDNGLSKHNVPGKVEGDIVAALYFKRHQQFFNFNEGE